MTVPRFSRKKVNLTPFQSRATSKLTPAANRILLPGIYRGGLELKNNNITLSPGIYIIEGGGIKMGEGSITINQAMIYNTGTNNTTSNADQFVISGNGRVTWTAPTSGPYAGIAYFQNRSLADKKVQVSGNGPLSITGAIYAKSAEIQLSGNGGTIGTGIVAASMQISGDGSFGVNMPSEWGNRKISLVD